MIQFILSRNTNGPENQVETQYLPFGAKSKVGKLVRNTCITVRFKIMIEEGHTVLNTIAQYGNWSASFDGEYGTI